MSELYWITRLDAANVIIIICLVISLLGFLWSLCVALDLKAFESKEPNIYKKCFKAFSISLATSTLLCIFTPSERDMLLIYGVGGTIEYIRSNETAKQLPDKCVQALDQLIDSYINVNKDN